jgi:hypothetical protein
MKNKLFPAKIQHGELWTAFKIMVATMMVLTLAACSDDPDPDDPPGSEVDFTSHTNYSIVVRNNSSERLVAFKNGSTAQTLIGGIPARTQKDHGLPMNLSLFSKTEDFALILLTETQYNTYKSNLSFQKHNPFTQIYAFYNKGGDNTAVYEIAAALGGNNQLRIYNPSSINVELRLHGVAGEILGYAPAGAGETTFRMHDGSYTIFPVFKRYNRYRDVIDTVYPKESGSDNAWSDSFSFGGGVNIVAIDLQPLLQNVTFPSGVAWVIVDNQTNYGIKFTEGNIVYVTTLGLSYIMKDNPITFQIDMPKTGNSYAESVTKDNWRFGTDSFSVPLQTDENDSTPLTTLTIEQDKMYTVTVTGSHEDNTLKAWISKVIDLGEL